MRRRETFIALRARREAFRIAADMLYHDAPDDSAPQPVLPLSYDQRNQSLFPTWISKGALILLAIMALCIIACLSLAVAEALFRPPTKVR